MSREETRKLRLTIAALVVLLMHVPFDGSAAAYDDPGSWSEPGLIQDRTAMSVEQPDLAANSEGDAIAVWRQTDGTTWTVWANAFVPGYGWRTPQPIGIDTGGDARSPQVSIDQLGNAMAVWAQWNSTAYAVWANRYVAGAGWGYPHPMQPNQTMNATSPKIAVDSYGGALASWILNDAGMRSLWGARFDLGTGWATPELLEYDDLANVWDLDVSSSPNGEAMVVWEQDDGNLTSIWARAFSPAGGWGSAELIEADQTGFSEAPTVILDSTGRAVAIWYLNSPTGYAIWTNRHDPTAGWGNATQISSSGLAFAREAQVAVDSQGDAWAIWRQRSSSTFEIWSCRFSNGSGWGPPIQVANAVGVDTFSPAISMDGYGHAISTWIQDDGAGPTHVWTAYTDAQSQWVGIQRLDDWASDGVTDVSIASDRNANALVVWVQGPAYGTIWSSRLVEAYPPLLDIHGPSNGTVTNQSGIWIDGLTEPGATVAIDGTEAVVSANGSFLSWAPLHPGANKLTVQSWDANGNEAVAFLNIAYVDPAVDLVFRLGAIEAELSNVTAELGSLMAQLSEALARLDSAESRLAILEASANSTADELGNATEELTTIKVTLAELTDSLHATEDRLSVLEGEVAGIRSEIEGDHANLTLLRNEYAHLETAMNVTSGALENEADTRRSSDEQQMGTTDAAQESANVATTVSMLAIVVGVAAMLVGAFAITRRHGSDH